MSVSPLGPGGSWARRGCFAAFGVALAASLSACANQTVQQHYAHGKEHFSQKKYGRASPKVVADGEPVPRGGGQYLVGHPYSVAGHTYYPSENENYSAVGMSSWYGAAFHGRRTANGEVYDMRSLTAAHPTMPLPSYARVTNLSNGYSVIVRVNDRGPYHGGRVMDVSSRTADVLDFKGAGTAKIKVEYVGRAPLEGSDDNMLLASLRTDGSAATLNGYSGPAETMVASAVPGAPQPSLFGTLFGSSQAAAPSPAPPPAAAAPSPPEPIRVAAVEPPSRPEPVRALETGPASEPDTEAPPLAASHRAHGPVPTPPPRPFDLGANPPPAAVTVASRARVSAAQVAVLPPRRPLGQATAEKALYFVEPPKRMSGSPFEGLKTSKASLFDQ